MELININNFNKDNLKIEKNNRKLISKYKNKRFIIDPTIAFENCTLFIDKKPYRIRFNIDNNNKHSKFKYIIDTIYDEISKYIEIDYDINVDKIINPFFKSKILIDNYVFYGMINNSTIIKDIDTKKIINIDSLIDNNLIIYPYISDPNINISNEIVYVNFFFHTIYIKTKYKEKPNKIENFDFNIDHIEKEINKYM